MAAELVDSYSETNSTADSPLDGVVGDYNDYNYNLIAQSFTGADLPLDSCKFYLKKAGSPTGNMEARLYAHTGVFGTSSAFTGSPLAVSDPVDISTLTTSLALVEFSFSGANRYQMVNGTKYVIGVYYNDGDYGNRARVGFDGSGEHAGNISYFDYNLDTLVDANKDVCFYVYGGLPDTTPNPLANTSRSISLGSLGRL